MAREIKNLKDLQNTEYGLKKLFSDAKDFLPLLGTDYVELYVGNAKQAAHFYQTQQPYSHWIRYLCPCNSCLCNYNFELKHQMANNKSQKTNNK